MKYSGIGGQAVIEGVMMKNRDEYATAVRKPDGTIEVKKDTYISMGEKVKLFSLPFFRGIFSFADSMILGMRALTFSASFFEDDEEDLEPSKFEKLLERIFGEKMEKAGFNTLMGMGTVFVVLIFISLLIGGFRYISIFEEKLLNKQKGSDTKAVAEAEPEFTEPLAEEEELKDDLELAAVITAAIAASEGVSPSGLVVRSIKRAATGNWKKA